MDTEFWPYVIGIFSVIWLVLGGLYVLCRLAEDSDEEERNLKEYK